MGEKLSKKQIGLRIAQLRKTKGMSQEELANNVGISRPSLTQIELGNRSVDLLEIMELSQILGFSIDEFVSADYVADLSVTHLEEPKPVYTGERITVPTLQLNKFRNVLLYILEKCSGKPNVGETVLYKLLYFSDFNHYELYEEHLTGAVYRKLPFGPVPQKIDAIINRMIEQKELLRIKTEYHGYPQSRYLPLVKTDLTALLASEKEVIDRVIDQMSNWSAKTISNYSHKDMPWMTSKEGDIIDYELVFYREAPFSVRNYEDEAIQS